MYELDLKEAYCPAQTDTEYKERTIEGVLREQVAFRPDALALRELLADGSAGRDWTYAELLADSERVGRALAARHPKGTRIAVMGGNCPEWVLLQMGA
ncbi:MAG: AMP-binding protein, partial [Pseudomonadota bacterium]